MDRYRHIVRLALPMIGSITSYSLIGLVDLWIVGHLSAAHIAAVGLAGFALYTAVATVSGVFPAVQSQVAWSVGAEDQNYGDNAARAGLHLCLGVGTVLALVLYLFSPWIFPLLSDDPVVVELARSYFLIRLLALPLETSLHAFMGANMGWGKSSNVFWISLITNVSNALISYVLVLKLDMGLEGAAIGTALGVLIAVSCYVLISRRWIWGRCQLQGLYRKITAIAVPACSLDLATGIAWTALVAIAGLLGTPEQAVITMVVNLVLILILPAHGFGMAGGTVAGWSLGAKDADKAYRDAWDALRITQPFILALAIGIALAAPALSSLFLQDQALAAMALPLLWAVCLLLPLDAFGAVMMEALVSVADTARATRIGVFCLWGVGIAGAWTAVHFGGGLFAVWMAFFSYRLVASLLYTRAWQQRRWVNAITA